jgi:hypothetical protein
MEALLGFRTSSSTHENGFVVAANCFVGLTGRQGRWRWRAVRWRWLTDTDRLRKAGLTGGLPGTREGAMPDQPSV